MKDSVKDRLVAFINAMGLNYTEFGNKIGVSNSYVTSMRTSLSPDKFAKIASAYPQLNIVWLMTGEGEMFNDGYKPEVNNVRLFARMIKEIKYQEGLNQQKIADELGVTRQQLSDMCNGRREVTEDIINKVYDRFDFLRPKNVVNVKNAPVKICLYKRGLRAYINTGIFLDDEFWDKDKLEVVGCARAADLNRILARKKFEIDNALSIMDTTGMSISRIKRELEKEEDNGNPLLYSIFSKYIDRCKAQRTRELYQATWAWIERYEKNSHNIEIDEIDYNWLSGLDKFMSNLSPSKNARNIHFRNLRAVFNYAIDEEYTTNYPFRKFKIKPEETEKRSLSVNELRSLICYNPTDDGEAFAKDFFSADVLPDWD